MSQAGFDYIIVTVNSAQQRSYWSRRLKYTLPTLFPKQAKIVVVEENWEGGAGNGLGTLYAIKTAAEREESLLSDLENGASVAVFHGVGLGKRIQPLMGSERNNKMALIMPGQAMQFNLTLLEALIKQAQPYALPQRVTVFWGDQLFLAQNPPSAPTAHLELYACFHTPPDKEKWKADKLNQYSVLTKGPKGNWQLFDKVRFSVYEKLAEKGVIDAKEKVGYSLGCFSLSSHFLNLLLGEYNQDLNQRKGHLNTDTDFWMPLLLDKKVYGAVCGEAALPQYERMQNLLKRVNTNRLPLFNAQDLGSETFWWDCGTLENYYNNLRKLLENTPETRAFKQLFGVGASEMAPGVDVDGSSLLINCKINSGTIRHSLLINVVAKSVHCADSVLIDVLSPQIDCSKALLYHCTSRQTINIAKEGVRCDIFDPNDKSFKAMQSSLKRDGKEDWAEKVGHNPYSYAELYELNRNLSMEKAEIIWFKERQEIAQDILQANESGPRLV